jgi:hypothetical protein
MKAALVDLVSETDSDDEESDAADDDEGEEDENDGSDSDSAKEKRTTRAATQQLKLNFTKAPKVAANVSVPEEKPKRRKRNGKANNSKKPKSVSSPKSGKQVCTRFYFYSSDPLGQEEIVG